MIEIEYNGGNSITITFKKIKLISDPKLSLVGLKDVVMKDAIEIVTEDRFATGSMDTGLIIHGPGEYGVDQFDIHGIPVIRHIDKETDLKESTIYRIEIDNLNIGLIGNIASHMSDDQLESLGVIDVLILPVGGGGYTLDAVEAADLIREVSPKVVIPIHYADPAVKYEVPQDDVSLFEKEMSGATIETTSKYRIKQPISGQETLRIIKLERR